VADTTDRKGKEQKGSTDNDKRGPSDDDDDIEINHGYALTPGN